MNECKIIDLNDLEMVNTNGGFKFITGQPLMPIFDVIDALVAFGEGLEEGYEEKCGCKDE